MSVAETQPEDFKCPAAFPHAHGGATGLARRPALSGASANQEKTEMHVSGVGGTMGGTGGMRGGMGGTGGMLGGTGGVMGGIGGMGRDSMRKIFVGGLKPHIDVDVPRDTFTQQFGRVVDAFRVGDKTFGFITFESNRPAQAALDAGSLDVDGTSVVIKPAHPSRSRGRDCERAVERRQRDDRGQPGVGGRRDLGFPRPGCGQAGDLPRDEPVRSAGRRAGARGLLARRRQRGPPGKAA